MTRKRMVGPSGGDFALDISTAGGRLGGGRITKRKRPTKTAKPKSKMESRKKDKPVKPSEFVKREVEKHSKMMARGKLKQDKAGAKRVADEERDRLRRNKKELAPINKVLDNPKRKPNKNSLAIMKLVEKRNKLELKHMNESLRKFRFRETSISGTEKGGRKAIRDFSRELRDSRNTNKELERKRYLLNFLKKHKQLK